MCAPSNLRTPRDNVGKYGLRAGFVGLQLLNFRVRDIHNPKPFFQQRRAQERVFLFLSPFEVRVFGRHIFGRVRDVSEHLRVPKILGVRFV